MEPKPHQLDALARLRNGSILVGGTGSGKAMSVCYITTPRYWVETLKDNPSPISLWTFTYLQQLKRDELDWEKTAAVLGVSTDRPSSINGVRLIVDSWNNIKKYNTVSGAFFIFDEQRSIGSGQWSKNF